MIMTPKAKNNKKKNKNKLAAIRSERTKFKNRNDVQDEATQVEETLTLPLELDSETDVAAEKE